MAGGDLLKPLDHTLIGESPSASEVEKDDDESEDDEEESGKSKHTKGVIIDGMGEVQIVNTVMVREEEGRGLVWRYPIWRSPTSHCTSFHPLHTLLGAHRGNRLTLDAVLEEISPAT